MRISPRRRSHYRCWETQESAAWKAIVCERSRNRPPKDAPGHQERGGAVLRTGEDWRLDRDVPSTDSFPVSPQACGTECRANQGEAESGLRGRSIAFSA